MTIRRTAVRTVLLAASALCAPAAPAQTHRPSVEATVAALVGAHEKRTSRAVVGASAVDLRTSQTLASVRDTRLFAPASNQKVLTSAFALARLGAGFKFVTAAHLANGDLVVSGNFDPILGDPVVASRAQASIYDELDRWAKAIKLKSGPRGMRDIVLLSSKPGRTYRHPDWPKRQHSRSYAAPAGVLNFSNNCLAVTFRVVSGKALPSITPHSRLVAIRDQTKVGTKHLWSLLLGADDSRITLTGTLTRSTGPYHVPINHPPLLFGRVLADRLARAGVPVTGRVRTAGPTTIAPGAATEACRTETPLPVVMRRANKHSLNMAAECMMLRAGDGTWAGSAAKMTQTLRKVHDVPAGGLAARDGSGLSSSNRVSPAAMTKVLAGLAGGKGAGVFLESLPISGVDGTLVRRLRNSPCRGRVRAKTGYIAGVCCLSGYVLDKAGRPAVAFSVLVNGTNSGAKSLQDSIADALARWVDR